MAFTNFGKRFFIYIQAVLQCHSYFPPISKNPVSVLQESGSLFFPVGAALTVFTHVLKS